MDNVSREKLIKKLHDDLEDISVSDSKIIMHKRIEQLLLDASDSDYATLYVHDNKAGMLCDYSNDTFISLLEVEGCLSKAYLMKKSAIYNHLVSDKEYVPKYDNPLGNKIKSLMLIPLVNKESLVGIISVSRAIKPNTKYYTTEEMNIVQSIESYLISIIEKTVSNVSLDIKNKIHAVLNDDECATDMKKLFAFFSNTVHDIRTPANNLFGFLELLEEEIDDSRLKEYISNAKESALYINELTDQILIKTKYKHDVSISKPNVANSVQFLSSICNTFSTKMSQKNIRYFFSISPNLPKEIKLETIKLKRVLINLIGNAYKFTPKNKRIDVAVTYDEIAKKMKISIKDQGIGISKIDQSKLFKEYSQATDMISEEYGGTGLGLSISANFIKNMGGKLELISEEGEGCEFYFSIPLEIKNSSPSYEKFSNTDKKIVILTEYFESEDTKYIKTFLEKLGMASKDIYVVNEILNDVTHIISFEHKVDDALIAYVKENNVELLLVEENLFSLLKDDRLNTFNIVAKNTYYEDSIYCTVISKEKIKILIADDNKINISLLKSMLSSEYVDMSSCFDGTSVLKELKKAAKNNTPYDIVFLDKHMPELSGTEVLNIYREYEAKHNLKHIYAVSISGDPEITEEEKNIFDMFANKPFDKSEIVQIISNYIK